MCSRGRWATACMCTNANPTLVCDREGLPSANVTALALANGYLYVGTDNGLVRVPEQKLHP